MIFFNSSSFTVVRWYHNFKYAPMAFYNRLKTMIGSLSILYKKIVYEEIKYQLWIIIETIDKERNQPSLKEMLK